MPPQESQNEDRLVTEDYAQRVDEHDKDLITIKERLDALEDRFGSNEQIADTLCETAEKASMLPDMIGKQFLKQLQHNVDIKGEIEKLVNRTDRNYFFASIKRIGWAVLGFIYSVVMIIIGVLVSRFLG